jgi:hypothetical protein
MAATTCGRFLEVVSGAEGAGRTGQNCDMLRSIAIEAAERLGEGARGRRIDRVTCGWPVDRHDRDRAIDVAANRRSL